MADVRLTSAPQVSLFEQGKVGTVMLLSEGRVVLVDADGAVIVVSTVVVEEGTAIDVVVELLSSSSLINEFALMKQVATVKSETIRTSSNNKGNLIFMIINFW